eukprot:COSAG02_NODE_39327_length_418_cov_1.097179_1_plen_90_part_10
MEIAPQSGTERESEPELSRRQEIRLVAETLMIACIERGSPERVRGCVRCRPFGERRAVAQIRRGMEFRSSQRALIYPFCPLMAEHSIGHA